MMTATGVVCAVFGSMILIGQLISTVNFSLAQRLGLQEKDADSDPLYRRLELTTARWDLFVLWTLPAAGALMLVDHAWWPFLALVAGGVYVDAAGRESAKTLGLRRGGVRTGSDRETRTFLLVMAFIALLGLWCIGLSFATLT